jgi:hypothetical protein
MDEDQIVASVAAGIVLLCSFTCLIMGFCNRNRINNIATDKFMLLSEAEGYH